MQNSKHKKKFIIDHIDPLGQGVSKEDHQITFIPKTLPEEEGTCEIHHHKKNIEFAQALTISKTSPLRETPKCPHFASCPSCHFLHTSYQQELIFKKKSFERELKNLNIRNKAKIIPAENRFYYRNRVQLHYDFNEEKMGYINAKDRSILEVPHCLLPQKEIISKLQQLYQNKFQGFPQSKSKGHLEISICQQSKEAKVSFNNPYAHGGFSQVNNEMNKKVLNHILNHLKIILTEHSTIFDLFGGKGNLTDSISQYYKNKKCYVVDKYAPNELPSGPFQQFVHLDLFKKNSEKQLLAKTTKFPELIIVDPPRSGFKNMMDYVCLFKPKHIVYMSCKTSTMVRDLKTIADQYTFQDAFLFDFFPGTYHYESLIFASLKS